MTIEESRAIVQVCKQEYLNAKDAFELALKNHGKIIEDEIARLEERIEIEKTMQPLINYEHDTRTNQEI